MSIIGQALHWCGGVCKSVSHKQPSKKPIGRNHRNKRCHWSEAHPGRGRGQEPCRTIGVTEQRPKDRLDPKAPRACRTAGKVTVKSSFRPFSVPLPWLLEMHAPRSPVSHSPSLNGRTNTRLFLFATGVLDYLLASFLVPYARCCFFVPST